MTAAKVFQFIGVSLIPIIITILLYLGFKHVEKHWYTNPNKKLTKLLKTERSRYWFKQIIVGLILGGFSIACFYLGITVPSYVGDKKDIVIGTSTFYIVLAGLVFGSPATIITSLIAATFRACIPSFLRWPTFTACLVGGMFIVLAGKLLFNNRRSKWYFAFLTGIFVESINMFLLFVFHLNEIGDLYTTIKQFDALCILCSGFAACITCLIIQIIEKEPFILHVRKDKRINTRVQITLVGICLFGLILISGATYLVSYADAFDTCENNLYNGTYDMFYDFTTMKARTSPCFCVNRHVISDGGFCLTIVNRDVKEGRDYIEISDAQAEEISEYLGRTVNKRFEKGSIFGLPKNLIDKYKDRVGTIGFEFDDGTTVENLVKCSMNDDFYKCKFVYNHKKLLDKEYIITCSLENNIDRAGDTPAYFDSFYSLTFIPVSEITDSAGISFRVAVYLNLLVFISLFAILYSIIDKRIIHNIKIMDNGLEKIMDGNLNEEIIVPVNSYHEFKTLSNNVNLAIGALKNYAQEVEHKMAAELQVARDIQISALPTAFPVEKEFNVYALMNPAKEVGGDFYDYIKMNNGRILLLNADVSGKGIPAAMFMMRAKTLFKSLASTSNNLEDIVFNANNVLCEENNEDMFVTAWIGIFNPSTGELNFVNAGHTVPLIKRKGKFVEFNNKHNLVLAALPNTKYEVETVYLEPGEEILVYTDGVTEAVNDKLEMYGMNRLKFVANNTNYFNAKQLLVNISDNIAKFSNGVEQFDDITMSMLIYNGKGEENPENTLTLIAKPVSTTVAINYVESVLASRELDPKFISRISIVIDELFANVAFYAYPKGKEGDVTVTVDTRDDMLKIRLIDSGTPFDPTTTADPDVTASIDERTRGGLGIFIVKNTMDDVRYEYKNFQNILYLDKKITEADRIKKTIKENKGE